MTENTELENSLEVQTNTALWVMNHVGADGSGVAGDDQVVITTRGLAAAAATSNTTNSNGEAHPHTQPDELLPSQSGLDYRNGGNASAGGRLIDHLI